MKIEYVDVPKKLEETPIVPGGVYRNRRDGRFVVLGKSHSSVLALTRLDDGLSWPTDDEAVRDNYWYKPDAKLVIPKEVG